MVSGEFPDASSTVFIVFCETFKYIQYIVYGMPENTIQLRVYKKDWDRLKNFGRAGDSMAEALSKVLDIAENKNVER